MSDLKSKVVGFVRSNKSVFIFVAIILAVVAIYLAWKNRDKLIGMVKDNYNNLSAKFDNTLAKLENK